MSPRLDPDSTEVAETLIEITGAIARGAETIEIFTHLAQRCVAILPVAGAGILLRDAAGDLQVIGASSPSAHLLDLFQVQNEQGPCLVCLQTGEQVFDLDLSPTGPWPRFASLVRDKGFAAVYALPLRSRHVAIGALNLFTTQALSPDRLVVAQALADTATLSLLQVDTQTDTMLVIQRIHKAVEARNIFDQARGMLAQRFTIDSEEATARLVDAAHVTGLSLTAVSRAVVTRDASSPATALLAAPIPHDE